MKYRIFCGILVKLSNDTHPLKGAKETATILTLMINSLSKRLREKNISIALSPEAKKVILKQGYNPEYGARPLRRVIEHLVEDRLSEELLRGNISFGDNVLIDHNGERFLFEKR